MKIGAHTDYCEDCGRIKLMAGKLVRAAKRCASCSVKLKKRRDREACLAHRKRAKAIETASREAARMKRMAALAEALAKRELERLRKPQRTRTGKLRLPNADLLCQST